MTKPCCVPGEMLCNKCLTQMELEEEEPITVRRPPLSNPLDTSYVKVYGSRVLPTVTTPPRAR